MPKIIKKKTVKRAAVKEEDVKSAALQAIERVKERQTQVITGISITVILIVLIVIYSTYASSKSKEAYLIETEAYNTYYGMNIEESMSEEDKWKKALVLYTESADIKVTPTALFYLGNCYYNLGDYENAIKEYNRFVKKFSRAKGILPLVYQKLASAYFNTAKNDNALDALAQLAKVENRAFKDTALILEARHYEGSGQAEKAQEIYRELTVEFPNSPWSGEAGSKIASEEAQKVEAGSEGSVEKTGNDETTKEPVKKIQEDITPEPADTKD